MTHETRILTIGIDGLWMPMDFARLFHLIVRFYRFEQLAYVAAHGGRNFFDDRLDAVALKYLAAFDWLAAPLMSDRFNQSYADSEAFVAEHALDDIRVRSLSYGPEGHVAFSGVGAIALKIRDCFDGIRRLKERGASVSGDNPDKLAEIEAIYGANMRDKANLMKDMGYSDAELHAIVSPSIEDLHFISNAMTQGRIVSVSLEVP